MLYFSDTSLLISDLFPYFLLLTSQQESSASRCNSTWYGIKHPLYMVNTTYDATNGFDSPYEIITIKRTILVIEIIILIPKLFKSVIHIITLCSMKWFFDKNVILFHIIFVRVFEIYLWMCGITHMVHTVTP